MAEALSGPAVVELSQEREHEMVRWFELLLDRAMFETVRRYYPEQAVRIELSQDVASATSDYSDQYGALYNQAVADFHFAQARGLELGYLSLFLDHIDIQSRAAGQASSQIEELRNLAFARGLTQDEFGQLQKMAARILADSNWQQANDTALEWNQKEWEAAVQQFSTLDS